MMKALYNILIEFSVFMKVVGLVKMFKILLLSHDNLRLVTI
jgi:hypothetical protein